MNRPAPRESSLSSASPFDHPTALELLRRLPHRLWPPPLPLSWHKALQLRRAPLRGRQNPASLRSSRFTNPPTTPLARAA